MLELIWQGSIVLSLTSIGALLMLFVRRLIIQANDARLERRRAQIKKRLIAYISSDTPQGWNEPMKSIADERILLGIASDLLQSVTGIMRTRILALLNTVVDIERMLRLLRRGNAVDRAKVAARLFWSQDPHVHAELRKALLDPEPEVVLAACNTLIGVGQHIDLAELMPLLKARDMLDHRGVRDLIRRLARNNTTAITEMITGDDHDMAAVALDSLGANIDPALLASIKTVAQIHRSTNVRASAIRALGNANEKTAAQVIEQALNDLDWEVRVQAAIAIGRLKLVNLAPRLAECLESDNWWLQWRAAQSLAKLGQEGQRYLRQLPFDSPAATLADVALAEVHSA